MVAQDWDELVMDVQLKLPHKLQASNWLDSEKVEM